MCAHITLLTEHVVETADGPLLSISELYILGNNRPRIMRSNLLNSKPPASAPASRVPDLASRRTCRPTRLPDVPVAEIGDETSR
jgi:hypothetical protein